MSKTKYTRADGTEVQVTQDDKGNVTQVEETFGPSETWDFTFSEALADINDRNAEDGIRVIGFDDGTAALSFITTGSFDDLTKLTDLLQYTAELFRDRSEDSRLWG